MRTQLSDIQVAADMYEELAYLVRCGEVVDDNEQVAAFHLLKEAAKEFVSQRPELDQDFAFWIRITRAEARGKIERRRLGLTI